MYSSEAAIKNLAEGYAATDDKLKCWSKAMLR